MSTLTAEHIQIGAYLWYSGSTSRGRWNCPAIIAKVDTRGKYFWVRSLDDMQVQDVRYHFTCGAHDPDSRKSMRPASEDEVIAYLRRRRQELTLAPEPERRAFLEGLKALPDDLSRLFDEAA